MIFLHIIMIFHMKYPPPKLCTPPPQTGNPGSVPDNYVSFFKLNMHDNLIKMVYLQSTGIITCNFTLYKNKWFVKKKIIIRASLKIFQKLLNWWNSNCTLMIIGWPFEKFLFIGTANNILWIFLSSNNQPVSNEDNSGQKYRLMGDLVSWNWWFELTSLLYSHLVPI